MFFINFYLAILPESLEKVQYNKNRIDVKDSLKIIFRDTNSFFKVGRVIHSSFAIYLDLFVCLFVEKIIQRLD